jgi:hypothetical protein
LVCKFTAERLIEILLEKNANGSDSRVLLKYLVCQYTVRPITVYNGHTPSRHTNKQAKHLQGQTGREGFMMEKFSL